MALPPPVPSALVFVADVVQAPGDACDAPEAWQRVAAGFLLGYAGASRAAYAGDLRGYLAWCAERDLDPLAATRGHVDAYAEGLRTAGAAPATVARRLSALAGFYAYAVDEGHLECSPVSRVRRPRVGEHAVSTGLSREVLTALVTSAERDGPRSLAAVLLLGLNGLRVSEVCTACADGLATQRGHRVLAITRKGERTARVPC